MAPHSLWDRQIFEIVFELNLVTNLIFLTLNS